MLEEFTRQILSGEQEQIKTEDVLFLLDADLEMLCRSADRIRKHFCKDHGDLCTIWPPDIASFSKTKTSSIALLA